MRNTRHVHSDELGDVKDDVLPGRPLDVVDMVHELERVTGVEFGASEARYNTFITAARTEMQNSGFADGVSDLHAELLQALVAEKVRAVDAWASGETAFNIVTKSWDSVVDKLYRLNIEENTEFPAPPKTLSIVERAARAHDPGNKDWIAPDHVASFADDLVRTKFVLPFADGVQQVSDRLVLLAKSEGLEYFRRYHAKDSGYHAHHFYVVMSVPTLEGGQTQVALEIKVLTKLQDTLGELTHALYALKRTGKIKAEKKRKLAWLFESPDFAASYLGHSTHYIESEIVRLKDKLATLKDGVG